MLSLDLSGKNALIGGSTQGIGLASAQALASLSATCVLVSRNEEKLVKAVATLDTKAGQKHSYLVADYVNPAQVQEVVAAYVKNNIVHILVNNSGGPAGGPVSKAKQEEFLAAFQQHLICNHVITMLVKDGMQQAGYGR